jgi:hypothetical protein
MNASVNQPASSETFQVKDHEHAEAEQAEHDRRHPGEVEDRSRMKRMNGPSVAYSLR